MLCNFRQKFMCWVVVMVVCGITTLSVNMTCWIFLTKWNRIRAGPSHWRRQEVRTQWDPAISWWRGGSGLLLQEQQWEPPPDTLRPTDQHVFLAEDNNLPNAFLLGIVSLSQILTEQNQEKTSHIKNKWSSQVARKQSEHWLQTALYLCKTLQMVSRIQPVIPWIRKMIRKDHFCIPKV